MTKEQEITPAKLGIIGYGFVGEATAHSFNKRSNGIDNILHHDIDSSKGGYPLREVIDRSDYIFISIPTPMREDINGNWLGIDLSIVEDTINNVTQLTDYTKKIVIIRSTVAPGTTQRFEEEYPMTNFSFNPEFLKEATYLEDALKPDRIVLGSNNSDVGCSIFRLYQERFREVPIYQVGTTEAEIAKYHANVFLATKVAIANLFYDLCQSSGANYEAVKEVVGADPRIGKSHLSVTEERGFGGKCFPKDMAAIMGEFRDRGLNYSLLAAIWGYNLRVREIQDWKSIPGAVTVMDH